VPPARRCCFGRSLHQVTRGGRGVWRRRQRTGGRPESVDALNTPAAPEPTWSTPAMAAISVIITSAPGSAARCFLAICTNPPGGDVLRRRDKSGVNCRSQPSSQAASDGSDRPISKTTHGNMPSIRFMSDAMRKARSSTLSLAGSCSAAHSQPPSAEASRQ
jgi:hypothetical protein